MTPKRRKDIEAYVAQMEGYLKNPLADDALHWRFETMRDLLAHIDGQAKTIVYLQGVNAEQGKAVTAVEERIEKIHEELVALRPLAREGALSLYPRAEYDGHEALQITEKYGLSIEAVVEMIHGHGEAEAA